MSKIQINWPTELLLKFWPRLAMKLTAKKIGIENSIFDKLHEVFPKTKSIDLLPLKSSHRGFMIIIDRKTALYFH